MVLEYICTLINQVVWLIGNDKCWPQFVYYFIFRDSTEKSSKTSEKYCCVPTCHNTSGTVLPDGHQIMLHRLPAE